MSYEGTDYYLTSDGRLITCSPYEDQPKDAEWYCAVDETNGYIEDDPSTHTPETNVFGFVDIWREDHYGNKYAIKSYRYAPANGPGLNEWRKVE